VSRTHHSNGDVCHSLSGSVDGRVRKIDKKLHQTDSVILCHSDSVSGTVVAYGNDSLNIFSAHIFHHI